MINLVIYKNCTGDAVGFEISGHAGYAEEGSDIICSAVSALAITASNAMETLTEDDFIFEAGKDGGYMKLVNEAPCHDANVILNTFAIGAESISEAYSDFICLTFKEV